MKILVSVQRNITENVIVDFKDLEELKECIKNSSIFELIGEQKSQLEEVVGEIIDIFYEDNENGVSYFYDEDTDELVSESL